LLFGNEYVHCCHSLYFITLEFVLSKTIAPFLLIALFLLTTRLQVVVPTMQAITVAVTVTAIASLLGTVLLIIVTTVVNLITAVVNRLAGTGTLLTVTGIVIAEVVTKANGVAVVGLVPVVAAVCMVGRALSVITVS
jgi:hypothetical protein